MNGSKKRVLVSWTIVLALLITVTVLIATVYYYVTVNRRDDKMHTYMSIETLSYDHDRLTFCYEQSISPCNDETVTAWNDTNDGVDFKIRSVQEQTERVIERIRLEDSSR